MWRVLQTFRCCCGSVEPRARASQTSASSRKSITSWWTFAWPKYGKVHGYYLYMIIHSSDMTVLWCAAVSNSKPLVQENHMPSRFANCDTACSKLDCKIVFHFWCGQVSISRTWRSCLWGHKVWKSGNPVCLSKQQHWTVQGVGWIAWGSSFTAILY